MQSLKHELRLREDEADSLVKFLELMESDGDLTGSLKEYMGRDNTTLMTSMKAGMVLMLYNAVESTMTRGLEKLHIVLMEQDLVFDECNDAIRQLLMVYYENMREKSPDINRRAPHILQLYDYMRGSTSFPLSYGQLCQFYSLYSGNLDAREIVSVLKKYGVGFEEKISELKTIKDNRNHLAHGELTFEEVGRELSVPQLKNMKEKTFEYMEKVIDSVDAFIKEKRYKKSGELLAR